MAITILTIVVGVWIIQKLPERGEELIPAVQPSVVPEPLPPAKSVPPETVAMENGAGANKMVPVIRAPDASDDLPPPSGVELAPPTPPVDPAQDPNGHARQRREWEIAQRFQQGVTMLQLRQYDHALTAFHRVLELNPQLAEAQVNAGYALLGKGELAMAADFFRGAIELNPALANAYYGLGEASEGLNDLETALGAMRSFLHLTDIPEPDNIFVLRARAAIWEMESRLGRGPWGPTRGIPPGFTADELRRDGTGVGIKGMKRGESLATTTPKDASDDASDDLTR